MAVAAQKANSQQMKKLTDSMGQMLMRVIEKKGDCIGHCFILYVYISKIFICKFFSCLFAVSSIEENYK